MKALLLTASLGVALLCDSAAPCRCAEQTLDEYFAAADEVAVGQLQTLRAVPGTDQVDLTFLVRGGSLSSPRPEAFEGDTIVYRTADNTAACGLPIQMLGTYVLFASDPSSVDEGEPWRIDTCSGSRLLLPIDGGEPASFVDVPARHVPSRLNALAGMRVLERVSANAPDGSNVANESLIGLIDVAGFSHAGFARLHERPEPESPVVAEVEDYSALVRHEVGYEEPGASVFARADGWSKLRLADGRTGWLPPDLAGTFFSYPDILVRRLAYIERPWHGFLWSGSGVGNPIRAPIVDGQREVPIEVHEVEYVAGFPWLRVSILRESPCEGGDGTGATHGWIPGFRPDGSPSAWYYSRGC